MNWFDQKDWSKFWAESHKSMFASWIEGRGLPPGAPTAATGASQDGLRQINELIRRSMEAWASVAQFGTPQQAGQPLFDAAGMKKLFDPAEWSRALTANVDLSLERLTEGPTYATLTDLDRKIVNAQKLWLQRAKDIEAYRQIVQAAWNRAFENFLKALNDADAPPLRSARAILDLWLSRVNDALIEMHHLPGFLEAQRRMTRSAAEYRLQERELAEAFCEANHIPTRTEVDEMQRTVHELRREVRALKRRLQDGDVPTQPAARPAKKGSSARRQREQS